MPEPISHRSKEVSESLVRVTLFGSRNVSCTGDSLPTQVLTPLKFISVSIPKHPPVYPEACLSSVSTAEGPITWLLVPVFGSLHTLKRGPFQTPYSVIVDPLNLFLRGSAAQFPRLIQPTPAKSARLLLKSTSFSPPRLLPPKRSNSYGNRKG